MAMQKDTHISAFIMTYQIPWLKAVAVIDLVTEMAILNLPIVAFHSPLMSMSGKTVVMMAFFTRVPHASPASASRLPN